MNKKTTLLSAIIGILFPIIILISAIEMAAFDKAFFMDQVEKNNVAKNAGIYEPDMELVVDEILNYLQGERADFDIQARITINGVASETAVSIFNEQEIVHMEDVLALLNLALLIRNLALVLFLIAFIGLLKWNRMGLIKGLFWGSTLFLGIIIIIGGFFYLNFDGAFTLFHQLVFSNDLWLMNPKTDRLIWIVPGPFFFNLIIRMVLYALLPLAFTGIGTGLILLKKRMK
ncbi:TIGR01906 family membrane protein [Acetobacterium bakii]|uniref:TIGR01906 family membrane protein n=1 Tax=Acetobacterium bakii TaxID=52689 RepID=A0A0L6TW89_9FIRM|nr:TIGR01906 family membrane protein [Acetobacterium bakii]KNZ40534.1 hypothetical protein AKG39_17150 [Acetobacterium bakii]